MAFLGSWPLVALVITYRFLLDSHPFLLEALHANNLGSLPFQVHLRLSRELLPLATTTCLPLFGQLVKKGTNHFKKLFQKISHDHSIFSNMSFDSHQTCLRSCARPCSKTWLCAHPIIPCFRLPSNVFFFYVAY
jgi:hypothetical protein